MESKMTDELQEPSKEPVVESVIKAENLVDEPNAISPTPKKSNKNLWIIAGITIALICICRHYNRFNLYLLDYLSCFNWYWNWQSYG
jgi:hypothetical protein